MSVRWGRGLRGSITVSGWTRADGKLWTPNTRVTVTSPWLWLAGADMLIAGCTYTLDERGAHTEIAIARSEAFVRAGGVEAPRVFDKLRTRIERDRKDAAMDWSEL
jgi:prophage tail gpP-like protein